MEIIGKRAKSGLGVVSAYLVSRKHKIDASVRFYVDTGASHTTIAPRDAERLGITYKKLVKAPFLAHGIGGVVEAYLLPDVMLIFEFNQSAFVEYPDEILVLGQTSANGTKKEEAMEIPSLLGVDILKDYAIKFKNQKIILER